MSPPQTLKKRPSKGRGPQRHTKEDWIEIALETLISEGVENVKVLVLSNKLETARSSFYWYFENREDLLDALLEHWRSTNTKAIVDSSRQHADTITGAIVNVYASWVGRGQFNTRLDFAIRDWARRSAPVRDVLDQSDTDRLTALTEMFTRFGYAGSEADVRARILYYTQIGYEALDQRESWETRVSKARDYLYCMSGQEPSSDEVRLLERLPMS